MREHGIVMIALALLAAAMVPAPVAADTDDGPTAAEKLYEQGRELLLTGQYDKAIEHLKKAVAADETKTSYRLALARAYNYSGQEEKAADELKAILDATASHVEAGQLLAEIYADREDHQAVVDVLAPLLRYRHDYTTYHLLARATYALDDYEKAREYFEEAVKLNPHGASDHYDLGNIYLANNLYALAAESYRRALELGLDSPVLRYKLGSAYFNLRNYFGQIAVVTVKSGQVDTISEQWYLIEPVPGQSDTFRAAPENTAIYQVARAMADGIEDLPDIHFLKANIYLNARRFERAYEMLGAIEQRIPEEDKALFFYYYAQAAFGVARYDEYLELLGKAIELDAEAYEPMLIEAYVNVAEQYNQAGEFDKYIHYLSKAVAVSPQTASLHLELANAYEENRQYADAISHWRMVLDLEPDHPMRMQLLNLIDKYRHQASSEGG